MSANQPKDGGPAYPTTLPGFSHPGMTMRQAYKLAALQGMVASNLYDRVANSGHVYKVPVSHLAAALAAEYADAMLVEDEAHAKGGVK